MATYDEILDTQLDPDAPITSGLGYQFRDNPIAIAEGAVGAPRVMGRGLSLVNQIVSYGPVGPTDPGVSDKVVITDIEGESIIFMGNVVALAAPGGSVDNLYLELSDNGGSSFAGTFRMGTSAAQPFYLSLTTGFISSLSGDPLASSGTVPLPAGTVNAIRFRSTGNNDLISRVEATILVMGVYPSA